VQEHCIRLAQADNIFLPENLPTRHSSWCSVCSRISQAELDAFMMVDVVLLTRMAKSMSSTASSQSTNGPICHEPVVICMPHVSATVQVWILRIFWKITYPWSGMMDPNRTEHLAITGGEPTLSERGYWISSIMQKHLPKTALVNSLQWH